MKKIISLVTLIILVASIIAGCGSVKSEAKDIYKSYFIKADKITTEFREDFGELADKYIDKEITKKKLNQKLIKLSDNAIEDLEDLEAKLKKEDVRAENKQLKIYATTFIRECEKFVAISTDAIINHQGNKSKRAIENCNTTMYNAGINFIREYNHLTDEHVIY